MLVTSHGGNVFDFAVPGLLDFSSNINPSGPPPHAMKAAAEALSRINIYPDTHQREIREAFSVWLGVSPDGLVFGNGASEMIRAVMASVRPSRVVVTHPTFSEYEECAASLGIPVLGIQSIAGSDFAFDTDGIKSALSDRDLLVICQPNNPTGVAWSGNELSELASLCFFTGRFSAFGRMLHKLVSSCSAILPRIRRHGKRDNNEGCDEGFRRSRPSRWFYSGCSLHCTGRQEKFAALAAELRGRGVRHSMRETCPEPYLRDSAAKIAISREAFSNGMTNLGYAPNPSAANFLLVRSDERDADEIHDFLLKRSILIRKCANFPALDGRYFRVAVRTEEDNAALLLGLASMAVS